MLLFVGRGMLLDVVILCAPWLVTSLEDTTISLYDWPDVLGTTWMFDHGSTFGYRPEPKKGGNGHAIRGPAPDWRLNDAWIPLLEFDAVQYDLDMQPSVRLGNGKSSCSAMVPNTNVAGPALSPHSDPKIQCNVTLAECCSLCDKDTSCAAFTWDPASDWSKCSGLPYCWTLTSFASLVPGSRNTFSSKGKLPPPAPGPTPSPPPPPPPPVPPLPSSTTMNATQYPGSIVLHGVGLGGLRISTELMFVSANVSLIRLSLSNVLGEEAISASFHIAGSAANATTVSSQRSVTFDFPTASPFPCFSHEAYGSGRIQFPNFTEPSVPGQALTWSLDSNRTRGSFTATSSRVLVSAGHEVVTYVAISSAADSADVTLEVLQSVDTAQKAFKATMDRWNAYLNTVLRAKLSADMQWVAVKSVQTLIYNWRVVPGLPDGVLPSYNNYEGGMWSWDTYKQAVGMVSFTPDLAKQQLRLLTSARDPTTGHIPDKVDRCGKGGGCSGKPPLLSWAVWEVYRATGDIEFLREMYPIIETFHQFWYIHRDVAGVGFCSWTEGMESGMDDGVRFMSEYAASISNGSVRTLDFWSIDLNAYLYKEKRTMASIAATLGNSSGAQMWNTSAADLLPRLQTSFYVSDEKQHGFFQDRYINGSVVPIQGSEGYAALFCEVATVDQAEAVGKTLSDPDKFLLGFSLPTVSKANKYYNSKGYWKGPTWLDQTWFAYTGLKLYQNHQRMNMNRRNSMDLGALADEIKRRLFAVGKGFQALDTTPLNEHYNAETGVPEGAQHFSWAAAHSLMWILEEHQEHGQTTLSSVVV